MEKEITITKKHLDVFKENTASIENKIVIHQGWTNDVAAAWPKDLIIDLLFIDVGHTYEDVSNDWENLSPFVRKGGLVVFHDYYVKNENGHPGVRKFVDGYIAGRIVITFALSKDWHGTSLNRSKDQC
jgi:predicted O-methyltransferase YrrM